MHEGVARSSRGKWDHHRGGERRTENGSRVGHDNHLCRQTAWFTDRVILDGELVVTDHLGRNIFTEMVARRKQVRFFAFDLLHLDGEDLRGLPLVQRKAKLKKLLPSRSPYILYVDHTRESGTELYQLICQLDLEGIVAKKADSVYDDNSKSRHWIKIKNPNYSQKEGRADLFKRAG